LPALTVTTAGVKETPTVPVPEGTVAVMAVSEVTVNEVAGTEPNFRSVAPVKPVPVMVTVEPAGALDGDTLVTWGHVPWTPLAAQAKVGYEPLAIFQIDVDHAGDAPVNVVAVCIPAVAVAPVVEVVPEPFAVVAIPVVVEFQNAEL